MAFFPKLTGESQRSYLLNAHFASLCFHFKQSHWTVPSSFNPVGQGAEVISAGSGSADTPSDFHFCQTIVFSLCKEYLQEGKTWKGQIIIFLGCIEREKKSWTYQGLWRCFYITENQFLHTRRDVKYEYEDVG